MKLNQLQTGQRARIEEVSGEGALRKHLLDMGMIPGAEVTLTQFAPMGDPMEIRIHGYALTLRLSEAEKIRIHPLDDARSRRIPGLTRIAPTAKRAASIAKRAIIRGWEKKGNFIRRAAAIRSRRARHYHLLWWATRTAAKRPCSTS